MKANWEVFIEEVNFEMDLMELAGFLEIEMRGSPFPGRIKQLEKFGNANVHFHYEKNIRSSLAEVKHDYIIL